MTKFLTLLFCAFPAIIAVGNPALENPPPFVPRNYRLAEKPAWERDVTPLLKLADGRLHDDVMSREARSSRVRGETLEWSLTLTRPPEADPTWPVALEADESRVLGGGWDRRDTGSLWYSGEGSVILTFTATTAEAKLEIESTDNPQVHENGFGRMRMRPATLDELVRFDQDRNTREVTVFNRGPVSLTVKIRTVREDYFGGLLENDERSISLDPGAREKLAAPVLPHYKTRFWAEADGRKTLEYHTVTDGQLMTRERPRAVRLPNRWQRAFVPGPIENNPPPKDGWTFDERPAATSHWMWARQSFTIPADWPAGQRVALLLPNPLSMHAVVLLDGKEIGSAASWELPKTLLLPRGLRPGGKHEIQLGITDYIVGLDPAKPLPKPGPYKPGNRSFFAPASATGSIAIGVSLNPEICPVPELRTTSVAVQPVVNGGKVLRARITIANDSETPRAGSVRSRVFRAGRPVFDLGEQKFQLGSGESKEIVMSKPWAEAELWNLENPALYELRTEIADSGGLRDTRRDRFGFREISTRGNAFTLNGEVLKLHGGSHVFTTALQWPARPSPYRILRHQGFSTGITGGGQTQGIISLNAADELGYLIKADIGAINAHGGDPYDWQNPLMWQRLLSGCKAIAAAYLNHPSVVLWDIGNEVSFRGPGEAEKMGQLFAAMRAYDPTRLVNIGGSKPFPEDAELLCFHGWGDWETRSDYWFMRPDERPSYLKNGGYFIRPAAGEDARKWKADLRDVGSQRLLYPGTARELVHVADKPIVFAEGVYMENIDTFPIHGHDTYLPVSPVQRGNIEASFKDLNMTAGRSRQVQNLRQAGFASAMIHVSGGTGRSLFPVASFSWDRKFRFVSGSRMKSRYGIHYDLSNPGKIEARYRLLDGDDVLDELGKTLDAKPGDILFADLDFPLPETATDKVLRLEVRVAPVGGGGEFRDSLPVTVFANDPPRLPDGVRLAVFDPHDGITPHLRGWKIPHAPLDRPSAWNGGVLLIGPEALAKVSPEELASLGKAIAGGGQAIVMQQFSLPQFLARNLVQNAAGLGYAACLDGGSPVTRGLLTEDFRTWSTVENDQIVAWNPLETPASGHFRAHLNAGRNSPVLEIGEGKGRALFVQLNLKNALGPEPAATRVFRNLLEWAAEPSPFAHSPTLLVASDPDLADLFIARTGLNAAVSAKAEGLESAELVIVSGTDANALAALDRGRLASKIGSGATLYVHDLDEAGAAWLSGLTGKKVSLKKEAFPYAYLICPGSPFVRGLGHGDFFPSGLGKGVALHTPQRDLESATGEFTVSGPGITPLTRPAYLAEIPLGKGRILIDLVRSLKSTRPSQARVLSMLLGNAGARLDPDGIDSAAKGKWDHQPLDLAALARQPLVGALRELPAGPLNLLGVDYLLPGKSAGGGAEVPVGTKADRLYFLHASGGAIYRIYYADERKAWIPGKPDPFIDVLVKPGHNIADPKDAGSKRFLPGAAVAWLAADGATGIYQMAWDNPHPEKTIGAIGLIPPSEGGHAQVFAVTAARREISSGPARPAPPLEKVLPAGRAAADVLRQVDHPRYGFLLMKDGTIGSVYDRKGRPFFQGNGWSAEAKAGDTVPGGKPVSFGRQQDTPPEFKEIFNGSRRVYQFSGETPSMSWKATVTATPARLRYDLAYTPKTALPDGYNGRLHLGVKALTGCKLQAGVNQNPATLVTPAGPALLTFDRRYTRWVFNYEVWNNGITFKSPPMDTTPFAVGTGDSLWWELTPP